MSSGRWAVFISGRGSNAQCLFDELSVLNIALCVSSQKKAGGLLRAKRAGVATLVLDKNIDWDSLHRELVKRRIDKIFLLGFMRLLPEKFVDLWQGRLFNLHPSLLPLFPGKDSIKLSYDSGSVMGVSIHHVITEMDAGPLILQKKALEKSIAGSHSLTSDQAHFLISRTEQTLVKKTAMRLNFKHTKAKETGHGN